MPAKDLIEFILYILPGFIAIRVLRAVHLVARPSDFQQTAWSLMVGVAIVSVVRWLDSAYFGLALHSDSSGVPHPFFFLSLTAVGVLVGVALTGLDTMRLRLAEAQPKLRWIAPDPQTVWAKINRPSNTDWAVVFLDDGAIYIGCIATYRFNPDVENQDFLLAEAARVNENRETEYEVNGVGVYLSTKNVRRIEFFKGKPSASETTPPVPLRAPAASTELADGSSEGTKEEPV
jgi:Family of unknown function (DUF6338)